MSGFLKLSSSTSVKELLSSDYITLVGGGKNKKISYPDFLSFINVISSTDGGAPIFFEGNTLPSVDNTGEPLSKGNWVLLFEGSYTNPSITVPAGKLGFAIHNGTTFVLNKTVDLPVGASILNGSGAPSSGLGKLGDFYIDTANTVLYGAKTSGGWGVGVSLTAKDYVDEKIQELEGHIYGDNTIPFYLRIKENVNVAVDSLNPVISGIYYLGANDGVGYVPEIIPAGTYTILMSINFSSKGDLDNVGIYSGTSNVSQKLASEIELNEDYYFTVQRVLSTDLASGGLLAQIRTRYLSLDVAKASFVIKEMTVYQGNYTLSQLLEARQPVDKTKVLRAKEADFADIAQTAITIEKLPEKYINEVYSLSDKIEKTVTVNSVIEWTSVTGGIDVINEVVTVGGVKVLRVGGKYDDLIDRLWFGFQFLPSGYASQAKTYLVVAKGRVKSVNLRNFEIFGQTNNPLVLAQDLQDNVWTNFEAVGEFYFPAGTDSNSQYVYTRQVSRSGLTTGEYIAEFEVFTAFEKNSLTEGLSLDDLIRASKGGYETFKEEFIPKSIATKNDLEVAFSDLDISKLSPNDYEPIANMEMLLGWGQSLEYGGGAISSADILKNVVTFSAGSWLDNNNASSTFVDANTDIGRRPINATVLTILDLLKKENRVDIEEFGNKYLIAGAGVSGGSITVMNKGTTAYSNAMASITRAKALCDSVGDSFKVSAVFWAQGEGDRGQTQSWYYTRLKQLFEDINTDVKAITGQTEDIKFFVYQTSPWADVWYPSGSTTQQAGDNSFNASLGVQKAQLQVINEMPNVYSTGAMYQYVYGDFFHPSDRAVVGLLRGLIAKRVLYDNEEYPTFKPLSYQVIGNFLNIKFDVPVKPMRFDIGSDIWHNSTNGKQINYGFKVINGSGVNIIQEEPRITQGDTLVIKCSASPIGCTVTYAVNGHYGGGNLCDSLGAKLNAKGNVYSLDNYALAFDDFLII